jgi:hypothetical protein
MGRFERLVKTKRLEREAIATSCRADPLEWNAEPLGRLGRELLADIEAYLEFFEIACADLAHDRTSPAP